MNEIDRDYRKQLLIEGLEGGLILSGLKDNGLRKLGEEISRDILNAMDNAQIDTQHIREAQRIYNGVIE